MVNHGDRPSQSLPHPQSATLATLPREFDPIGPVKLWGLNQSLSDSDEGGQGPDRATSPPSSQFSPRPGLPGRGALPTIRLLMSHLVPCSAASEERWQPPLFGASGCPAQRWAGSSVRWHRWMAPPPEGELFQPPSAPAFGKPPIGTTQGTPLQAGPTWACRERPRRDGSGSGPRSPGGKPRRG